MHDQMIKRGDPVAVRPIDVNVDKDAGFTRFWDTFKTCANENAAGWLVLFAQSRGSWEPFLTDEMEKFYQGFGHHDFSLQTLVECGYIVESGGQYYFTYRFVGLAYGSSPNVE